MDGFIVDLIALVLLGYTCEKGLTCKADLHIIYMINVGVTCHLKFLSFPREHCIYCILATWYGQLPNMIRPLWVWLMRAFKHKYISVQPHPCKLAVMIFFKSIHTRCSIRLGPTKAHSSRWFQGDILCNICFGTNIKEQYIYNIYVSFYFKKYSI